MKVLFTFTLVLLSIFHAVDSMGIRRKKLLDEAPDYESSGDYFEVTVKIDAQENVLETTTEKAVSEENGDDGVTCSQSNFTQVLYGYDLENHALAIFKVNVSSNERELVLFLNLAKRFFDAATIFFDYKFIVITSDHSSEIVMEFIEKEGFPSDIVVIDEDEFNDFGFDVDLDDLHAYIVDQCGRLAYIIVPPWSSAQHPYVKAALMSTIIDLPCGCPSEEFASNLVDELFTTESQSEISFEDESLDNSTTNDTTFSSSTLILSTAPVIDIDTDDVENIEDLLDNSNALNHSKLDGDAGYDVPLRIVIPSVHMHYDTKSQNYWKYDQIVLKTGNQSFHDHLQDGEKLFEFKNDQINPLNLTNIDDKIFVGNRSILDIQKIAKSDKIFIDRSGKTFKVFREIVGPEKIYELSPVEFDLVKLAPVQKLFGVKHHYEKLNRWLMFKI